MANPWPTVGQLLATTAHCWVMVNPWPTVGQPLATTAHCWPTHAALATRTFPAEPLPAQLPPRPRCPPLSSPAQTRSCSATRPPCITRHPGWAPQSPTVPLLRAMQWGPPQTPAFGSQSTHNSGPTESYSKKPRNSDPTTARIPLPASSIYLTARRAIPPPPAPGIPPTPPQTPKIPLPIMPH